MPLDYLGFVLDLPGCRYASSWFRHEVRRGKGGAKNKHGAAEKSGRSSILKNILNIAQKKATISYAVMHSGIIPVSCPYCFFYTIELWDPVVTDYESHSGVQHTSIASKHCFRVFFCKERRRVMLVNTVPHVMVDISTINPVSLLEKYLNKYLLILLLGNPSRMVPGRIWSTSDSLLTDHHPMRTSPLVFSW